MDNKIIFNRTHPPLRGPLPRGDSPEKQTAVNNPLHGRGGRRSGWVWLNVVSFLCGTALPSVVQPFFEVAS